MAQLYRYVVLRKATNMGIESDPLNLSDEQNPTSGPPTTLKQASGEPPRDGVRMSWREENVAAIQAYNEHIEKYGTFSDSVRKF